MRRERIVQLGALGVMIACMAASQVVTAAISASAGRNRLVYTDSAEEGDPPEVALGIAMGAFRGMFVNMLWMRANERKNEGRYYDAVDLARTITKLQPRFPRVWVFHAWNLAYNISVATNTPSERWNWVNQGIRLLREEAIPKNPNELLLYRELAWLYLHKVQGVMDDANPYYKRRFAEEWTAVVGAPPRRTRETMDAGPRVNQLDFQLLRPIATAHDTLAEVEAAVPGASELVERLHAEAGLDLTQKYYDDRGQGPGEKLLRNFELAKAAARRDGKIRSSVLPRDADGALIRVLAAPEFHDARNALVNHIRKRLLLDKYHMEPDQMIDCMRKLGPLDWRHAASHAIYWTWRGVSEALLRATLDNRKDFDFLNTDRMMIHGVQEMFRSGELVFNILNPDYSYLAMPCNDFIPVYEAQLDAIEVRGGDFTKETRAYRTYAAGYENFLKDAIRVTYRRGQRSEAARLQNKLLTWTKHNLNNPARITEISVPLDEFVQNEIKNDDRFGVPDVALGEIVGSLQYAFTVGLANGDKALFQDNFDYAVLFHKIFTEKQIFNTNVNQGDAARMEFTIDRDFQVFAGQVLAAMIVYMGGEDGEAMYSNAPDELKAAAYVFLEGSPVNDAPDFRIHFPPPAQELLDQFTKRLADREDRRRRFQGTMEQK